MGIDNLLQNLFQALFPHVEIHFQLEEILRFASVHKSQVLRKNLIKNKPSQSGFHIARNQFTVSVPAAYSGRNAGMQGNRFIFISQNGFVHISEKLSFSFGARTLLGQIVNPQHHIL